MLGGTVASGKSGEYGLMKLNIKRADGIFGHLGKSENGDQILKNFVIDICKCKKSWTSTLVAKNLVRETREIIGNEKATIGLSGGIDSSVATALVGKAIGKKLVAVYVDTGLMRDGETKFIEKTFRRKNLNLKIVRAEKQFLRALKGVSSPEQKRKIIGKLFADIFYKVAKKEQAGFL